MVSIRRQFPDAPVVAVSALIVNEEQKFLAVKRKKEPDAGLWSLPGGAVELGEQVEDALAREILEEAGIQVKIIKIRGVFDRIFRTSDGIVTYHYVIINFLCFANAEEAEAGSDVSEVAWVSFDDIHTLQWTSGLDRYLEEAAAEFKGKRRPE